MPRISVLTTTIRPEYLAITQKTLEDQTYTDFEWLVEVSTHDGFFRLPENYNKMLRRARGEIIVSLQDCISLHGPDALARIAGLNHDHIAYTYPVGKYTDDESAIKWDWRDYPRAQQQDKITPNQWEIDLASAPRSLFFDIGGFDETFKDGWGWDNVEVGWRAQAAGYSFKVSVVAEGHALDHDALTEHPHRNKLPNNDRRANETFDRARHGTFKLAYL